MRKQFKSLSSIKLYILCILLCHWFTGISAAQDIVWNKIHTQHTIILYQSEDDLIMFHKSIKYGSGKWNKSSLFSNLSNQEYKDMLSQKVDAIFRRAQQILDMKKHFKKIKINIYPDKQALTKAYSNIYKGHCNIRAWYRYGNNSVYINVDDVHAGMLAHELAHGIIDHYLLVRPPSQTAEILARYVDSHLD